MLHDNAALTIHDVSDVRASNDRDLGGPTIALDLTSAASRLFQDLTAALAHRGATDSTGAYRLDFQHFAIAVNAHLVSAASIDFHQYPHGVVGTAAASPRIATLTAASARQLTEELRLGLLNLKVISSK